MRYRYRYRMQPSEKKELRIILRYLWFYLSLIYFLSLYSYLFDLLFCKIDYGTSDNYIYSVFQYFPFYIIMGYLLIPGSIIYNYIINKLLFWSFPLRILVGFLAGVVLALLVGEGWSYYIGEYRFLKNVLTYATTGVSIEFFRMLVVRLRLRDRRLEEERRSIQESAPGY